MVRTTGGASGSPNGGKLGRASRLRKKETNKTEKGRCRAVKARTALKIYTKIRHFCVKRRIFED